MRAILAILILLCAGVTFADHQVPIVYSSPGISCEGNAFYVANTGDDDNAGTSESEAWASVSRVIAASDLIKPGDCVFFKRGDTWNTRFTVPKGGNSSGYVTYGAYGTGPKPLFVGTGLAMDQYDALVTVAGKDYVILRDLAVEEVGIGYALDNAGIKVLNADHVKILDSRTKNTDGAGIKANLADDVTIEGNEVSLACANSKQESISLQNVIGFVIKGNYVHTDAKGDIKGGIGIDAKADCRNGVIEHNVLTNLNPNGIYVDAYGGDTGNIVIRHNLIHDTSGPAIMVGSENKGSLHDILIHHNIVSKAIRGGIVSHNKEPSEGLLTNIEVYNNTVYMSGDPVTNYRGGVRMEDELLTSGAFKNNIFSHGYNYQFGYKLPAGWPVGVVVDTNVVYGPNDNVGEFTAITGTNAIISNPLFTDPVARDFSLQAGSPAKEACDNSVWQGVPNIKDFNGVAITDSNGDLVVSQVSCGAIQ